MIHVNRVAEFMNKDMLNKISVYKKHLQVKADRSLFGVTGPSGFLSPDHDAPQGDTFFPAIDGKEWKLVSKLDFNTDAKHLYSYSFQVWLRN